MSGLGTGKELMKGQFARRAMELGGWPITNPERGQTCLPGIHRNPDVAPSRIISSGQLSKTRLVQAMRKIDPDLAHMIESLPPAYLVKR